MAEDTRTRTRAGDPSDAEVYRRREDGWVPLVPAVNVELMGLPGVVPH